MGQISTLLTQLGVNSTFFVMFGLFAITYVIVSTLLTKPLGHLVIERDKRGAGRQEEVSKIRVELTEIQERLSAERRRAQFEANQKFSELRSQAVSDQRKILTDARENFSAQVKTARDNVEKMLRDERQKLERVSSELKEEVVGKLLGTSAAKKHSLGKEI